MPDFCRAALISAPNSAVTLDRIPLPPLAPGAALLETVYSEVCGTDVHLLHGRLSGVPYPLIPGHVSVGRIAEQHGPIADVDGVGFRPGDLVTFLDVHETCNACYQCLVAKQTTRCPSRKVYGITYGAADGPLGGWAERIWMKPGVKMIRLPASLAADTFIGGGCGLTTAVHAVDRAEIRLGQSVAVLGAGPVGQSVVALAALSGAGAIIAVGGPAARLAFATRMGATVTIDLATPPEERLAEVRRLTGGRVVVVGQYTDHGPASIHPHYQINRKHVEIRGCWGSDYSHFHRAVEIATRFQDRVPWAEMVTTRHSLDEAGKALEAVERQTVLKALIRPN